MWGFKNWLETEAPDDLKDWTGADFPVPPARFVDLLKMWLAGMKKAENSRSDPKKFLPHEDYKDMLWIEDNTVMAASPSTPPPQHTHTRPSFLLPSCPPLCSSFSVANLFCSPTLLSSLFFLLSSFCCCCCSCLAGTRRLTLWHLRYARSGPGQYHSRSMGR
jgi:hypothetical protein